MATGKLVRLGLVLLSLILSLWHFGPTEGSLAALFLTVGSQVYLFGYLSARALGLLRETETIITRVAWIVSCGLGITIVIGAGARFLLLPVYVYVIGLHALMLLLSFVPAAVAPVERINRKTLPFYVFLTLICAVFVVVGWERNHLRFDTFLDQTYPISLAEWWAYAPQPEHLVSRNVADERTLTYWSSDGLTYVFAAWVWTGRFTAAQLIWYVLTPLFVWLVPIAHFALAYRLTKRMDTAAWATGIVLIFALTTINDLRSFGAPWKFGQEAAFQVNTLRTFSAALLLPLVGFVFFSGLRSAQFRHYLMTGIVALALALTHPRQYLAVITGLSAILAVHFLAQPSRNRLWKVALLGLILLPTMLIPFWQYKGQAAILLEPELLSEIAAAVNTGGQLIAPGDLLFHPFVPLALLLGIVSIVKLRHSLAAQFAFATTTVMLAITFVTPIFSTVLRLFGTYFGLNYVMELLIIVPIGLILGISLSVLLDEVVKRVRLHAATMQGFVGAVFLVAALLLLVEPFPIPRSARDQINAANQMEFLRDFRPFDEQLLDYLQTLPATGDKVAYLTSDRIASYVIESLPDAFITAGRSEANPAYTGSARFFDAANTPWMDADDIEFLQSYGVDYIVLPADNTRIPQLMMQPARFEQMASVAGFLVFRVREPGTIMPIDRAFAQMNELYQADSARRWVTDGFHLDAGVDTRRWQPLIREWRELVSDEPENDLARYGLALATLMAGSNQRDLWESLSAAHPDVSLLTNIYAHLLLEQGQAQAAVDVLLNDLQSVRDDARVLAAGALLSQSFFALLTPEQLDSVIATADADATTWSHLMEWNHIDELRTRAALLMSAGRLDVTDRWLSRIPEVEIEPRDLIARAAIQLAQGNIEAARSVLLPAVDVDWVQTRLVRNRERWANEGVATARLYQALSSSADESLPPRLLAETGQLFAMQAQIEQQDSQLAVSVSVGDFAPALPPQMLSIRVTSPEQDMLYGEASTALEIPLGSLQHVTLSVDLPPDLSASTAALVLIEPQHSAAVPYQSLRVETTLMPTQP